MVTPPYSPPTPCASPPTTSCVHSSTSSQQPLSSSASLPLPPVVQHHTLPPSSSSHQLTTITTTAASATTSQPSSLSPPLKRASFPSSLPMTTTPSDKPHKPPGIPVGQSLSTGNCTQLVLPHFNGECAPLTTAIHTGSELTHCVFLILAFDEVSYGHMDT